MKMVPRFTERLLTALGASAEFRDDVLGDLAEEFALRAEFDAPRARRWYYREAWRAAPYLLRDAWRNLRGRDVLGMTGSILISFITVEIFGRVFFPTLYALLAAMNVPRDVMMPVSWFSTLLFVLLDAIKPVVGGYVAAWSNRRAPLLAALTLGVMWAGLDIVNILRFGESWPAVYRYGAPLIAITFSTIGGLARVWRLSWQSARFPTRV